MIQKEKHMVKISSWKFKKEENKPSTMRKIVTVAKVIKTPYLTKHETPLVYTKITEDHNELLQSLLQKGLIQLPPMKQKTKIVGGFCGYYRVHGHKTCDCKNSKDIIQDLVDKKVILFEKQEQTKKTHVNVDNKKMGIYKNPMPQHNIGILYTQGNVMKEPTFIGAQQGKQQNEASISGGTRPFGYVI